MAKVVPFCGLRYFLPNAGDINKLVAPPYDVVSKAERDQLTSDNPYNIFHLELPSPNNTKTPSLSKYENAAQLLKKWEQNKIIARDQKPAIYPYDIEFTSHLGKHKRRGLVALLKVEPWERNIIKPHEKTFDKVTSDRLKLLEHTKTQFSQVFLLYNGKEAASNILKEAQTDLLYQVTDHIGNKHSLSMVTDKDCLYELCKMFSNLPMYIADGHHRYTTAIRFSQKMRERFGSEPQRAYNYLMVYLVDIDDPGLIVLPTHRVVNQKGLDFKQLLKKAEGFFDQQQLDIETGPSSSTTDQISSKIQRHLEDKNDRTSLAFVYKEQNKISCTIWRLKPEILNSMIDNGTPKVLAELDVTVLNDVVFPEILGITPHSQNDLISISYTPDSSSALRHLKDDQLLFILNPTPAKRVLDVADAGLVMPHKSTFFYPKILTGLVMNSVSETDSIDSEYFSNELL